MPWLTHSPAASSGTLRGSSGSSGMVTYLKSAELWLMLTPGYPLELTTNSRGPHIFLYYLAENFCQIFINKALPSFSWDKLLEAAGHDHGAGGRGQNSFQDRLDTEITELGIKVQVKTQRWERVTEWERKQREEAFEEYGTTFNTFPYK